MKKFALIGLALCVAFMLAAPAMALDVDFSGFYRVRGFCVHDYQTFGYTGNSGSLNEHADDHFDMLLDVNIVFKVHPKLKLVTNLTALDKIWGTGDTGLGMKEDDRNIDWNQAYMEFVTGLGMFRVGRMTGGAFEHPFLNTSADVDRIMWILPPKAMGGPAWNPVFVAYVFEKMWENDVGNRFSDEDNDAHYILTSYMSPNFTFSHLAVFRRLETFLSPALPLQTQKVDLYGTSPYVRAKFGPVTLEAEALYLWGYATDYMKGTAGEGDIEVEMWNWFAQATFDSGPFDVYVGWAHTDGDKDGSMDFAQGGDQTYNAMIGQQGNDWDLLFFLTSDEGMHAATFGGMGNWSSAGSNPYGMDLLYVGAGFDITPDINISGIWGLARADAVPTGSKQIGWEANLWLTWQIMDGLQYKALFAYFDADGFWEDAQNYTFYNKYNDLGTTGSPLGSESDSGQAWALFHQLTLSF
jgi:hypothetical protein